MLHFSFLLILLVIILAIESTLLYNNPFDTQSVPNKANIKNAQKC
ncbi:exported hypothetical protein [Photobacterium kishitanii]|nr:exported hypothetical protein [Photobacterium kishitanii]